MTGRAFGFHGKVEPGGNAILRETAALLGLPYREIDLDHEANIRTMLGEVVIESDSKEGTRSTANLGPLGKALTRGEVVGLNEVDQINHDFEVALVQIVKNGEFTLYNPDGADKVYEVHPSSILGMTRPSASLSSLLFTPRLVNYPKPEEETR
jgi:MoxR-like ATPase